MKKKDIIVLIFSCLVIGLAIFFMLRMLFPPKKTEENSATSTLPAVPETIDDATYKIVEGLSDYGKANLENIGKSDLFAGF